MKRIIWQIYRSALASKLGNPNGKCLSFGEMKRLWVTAVILVVAMSGCRKQATPDSPKLPVTENKTGVALYPKSTEWGTGSSAGAANGNTATTRQTDDAPQKVIDFYKQEIRDAKVISENFSDIVHTTITGK